MKAFSIHTSLDILSLDGVGRFDMYWFESAQL